MSLRRMNRREVIKAGAIGAVALTGAIGTIPARAAGPVTLRLIDPWAGTTFGDRHNAQIKKFTDSHPNIKVERVDIPFNDFTKTLIQGAAAGELPDIALIDNPDFHAFAALGVLADLTPQIKAWGQADKYFPGHWATTVYQGVNHGVPVFSNCLAWWTNSDMKGEAGVSTPVTWDDLKDAAAKMTKDPRFGLAMDADHGEQGVFQWLAFLWSAGSDLATINDAGGQKALQLWVDLVKANSMSKGVLGWDQWAVLQEFGNQRAAMILSGPWFLPEMKKSFANVKFEVSAIPKDKTHSSILGGENYGVIKTSKNVDAAWEYIAWTQQPENYKPFIQSLGMFPSRSDVATDEYWTKDPVLNVYLEAVKVARARAYGAKYPEMSAAIQDAMQAAISGQASVKDALDAAAKKITPLLPKA